MGLNWIIRSFSPRIRLELYKNCFIMSKRDYTPSGLEPSDPNSPHRNAIAHPTTNNIPAQTTAVNIGPP